MSLPNTCKQHPVQSQILSSPVEDNPTSCWLLMEVKCPNWLLYGLEFDCLLLHSRGAMSYSGVGQLPSTVEWARLGLLNLLRQKAWEFCLKITPESGQRPQTVCSLPLRWRGSCTPWDPRNIATVFRLVLAEGSRVQWPTAIGGRWNPGPCCWNLLGNEPALLAVWSSYAEMILSFSWEHLVLKSQVWFFFPFSTSKW